MTTDSLVFPPARLNSGVGQSAHGPVARLLATTVRGAFRVRTRGVAAVPGTGPALLVANHVTYADAFLLGAVTPRPVRFVMWHGYFDHPLFRPFCEAFRAIPIAGHREDAGRLRQAMDAIDGALAAGEVIGIFPEGRLTDDGELGTFRPGVERILRRRPVPTVPVGLRGLWGSWLSKTPYALGAPGPVEVRFGAPVDGARATAELLRVEVAALRGDAR